MALVDDLDTLHVLGEAREVLPHANDVPQVGDRRRRLKFLRGGSLDRVLDVCGRDLAPAVERRVRTKREGVLLPVLRDLHLLREVHLDVEFRRQGHQAAKDLDDVLSRGRVTGDVRVKRDRVCPRETEDALGVRTPARLGPRGGGTSAIVLALPPEEEDGGESTDNDNERSKNAE